MCRGGKLSGGVAPLIDGMSHKRDFEQVTRTVAVCRRNLSHMTLMLQTQRLLGGHGIDSGRRTSSRRFPCP